MKALKSWLGLFKREYLEHRLPFVWLPLGILALLTLAAVYSLGTNRSEVTMGIATPVAMQFFEIGCLALTALWLGYLMIAQFFYFSDSFNADRRNNAIFFWKSMPVSDLKILTAKFLTGMGVFALILFIIALLSGLVFFLLFNVAGLLLRNLLLPDPLSLLSAYGQVALFALVYWVLAMVWFAPIFAWVAGLSAVVGRWSIALAFVVPGLIILVENIIFFRYVPRGGYFWGFLSHRLTPLELGLTEEDLGKMAGIPFRAGDFVARLFAHTDWPGMVGGLAFAVIVIALASEWRRRRL